MKPTITIFTSLLLASSSVISQAPNSSIRELTILYTNDEHGWMEGMSPDQGAANLYQLWLEQEEYSVDGPFLVLSGGDNFTGPAISTWVQGESMVDLMNVMGYDASAVGNHEFDFGLDTLAERANQADYPYLSANMRWRENGESPVDLGILPYTVVSVNGLDIGIIGLSTTSTPYVTNPAYVQDLAFTDYETAVRQTMEQLEGTDLQIIVAHVCMNELETLIRDIQDLGIDLAGGGHCNELLAKEIGNTVILGGGFHFTAYAKTSFVFNLENRQIVSKDFGTSRNRGATANASIETIVTRWADSASDSLNEILAYSARQKARGDGLEQLIIDTWLEAYPDADIAVTNMGGVRTNLPEGEVTLSHIVNILPFANTIISVVVTGQVILEALDRGGRPIVAGLDRRGQRWIFSRTGEPLQRNQEYTLLLNSFMYAGGDNFGRIQEANPNGFDTGVNYRQPFVDWLKNQRSTSRNPLRF